MGYLLYLFKHLFDLPVTLYWNFRLFPFKTAIKVPVLFSRKTKFSRLHRGNFVITEPIRPFCIKFGVEGVEGVCETRKSFIDLGKTAKIIFKGRANLARGISLRCEHGCIEFGKDFYANCNLSVICSQSVVFGDHVLMGWNINIRDCDGHSFSVAGEKRPSVKPVQIGDHVWVAAYVDIMKGAIIKRGSIVAYRSCVLKPFDEENILIGGFPARKLQENIEWYC